MEDTKKTNWYNKITAKEDINHKKEEYLDVIYEEAQRLDSMIGEMLTLSKLELGAEKLHMEKHDLNSLVIREVSKYGGEHPKV